MSIKQAVPKCFCNEVLYQVLSTALVATTKLKQRNLYAEMYNVAEIHWQNMTALANYFVDLFDFWINKYATFITVYIHLSVFFPHYNNHLLLICIHIQYNCAQLFTWTCSLSQIPQYLRSTSDWLLESSFLMLEDWQSQVPTQAQLTALRHLQ